MNQRESRPRRRGAAIPIVVLVLLALVPAVFVFSRLAQVEVGRMQGTQSGLTALSLAREGLARMREDLGSGTASMSIAGARSGGLFQAYLYSIPGATPERSLYYAAVRGESQDYVRILLTTLEVVKPPRLSRAAVLTHDTEVLYRDRNVASAESVRDMVNDRAGRIAQRLSRLTRERGFSPSQFDSRLETMKDLIDSPELIARWTKVKAAMQAGRSRP